MDANDFVLLALRAMGGEIRGKTKLQKTVYFLGLMTGHLDDLGYRAHFYGPYSEQVADAANRLKSVGFVDRSVAGIGAVDRFGFEVCRTDFALNDDGKQIAEDKAAASPRFWRKLQEAAEVLQNAGDSDYMKLSVAAKTYFMLGEKKGKATMGELVEVANRFGWKVSKGQVQQAAKYLSKLGLVTLK
jgi:uncharacterized protein YwgA